MFKIEEHGVSLGKDARSYTGHKLVLSAGSRDLGKGQDLSSHVLDWRDFSDRTCEDLITSTLIK